MHSLPLFHRIAGQAVIVLGEGEAGEAKRRLVERAGGVIVGPDHPDARIAFIAMEAPEAAAERLRARGVLVNVADRPDLCDFTLPSILERGPVLVAVSTGGASAGLAKALRLRLEALLPAALGDLASRLAAARERIRERWPDPAQRRRAIDAALAEGGALDVLAQSSEQDFDAWFETAGSAPEAIHQFTLASDDPDDLTLLQARLLGTADLVAFEPGIAPAILHRARADAARIELQPGQSPQPVPGVTVILRRG